MVGEMLRLCSLRGNPRPAATTTHEQCWIACGVPEHIWYERPKNYTPFQTCGRWFQQWIRSGKLEESDLCWPSTCTRMAEKQARFMGDLKHLFPVSA